MQTNHVRTTKALKQQTTSCFRTLSLSLSLVPKCSTTWHFGNDSFWCKICDNLDFTPNHKVFNVSKTHSSAAFSCCSTMAAASVDSATVSVGTLKSNPSIFFDRMDEVQDSILHQHTASMLSMPSNLLRGGLQEMVRERDAEDVTKFPRPNMGNTDHLSLPEDKEDDEEVTIETDDDFSDDGVRYEPPIIKPLDDDATSADDTEAADNNMDMDPLSHSNPTQIQQRTSNTSNPSSPPLPLPQQMVIHDSKEQSDEFGDDHTPSSFLHSMDTENFDDEFNVHSRGRSDGVSQEMASSAVNTQHYIQRPSVRKSRLGATLKADFDDHEHSHSDHSHSDWSHSHSHEHKVEESPPSHTTMSSER